MEVFKRIAPAAVHGHEEQLRESIARGQVASRGPMEYGHILRLPHPILLQGGSDIIITDGADAPAKGLKVVRHILGVKTCKSVSARISRVAESVIAHEEEPGKGILMAGNVVKAKRGRQTVQTNAPVQFTALHHHGGVYETEGTVHHASASQWCFTSGTCTTRVHVDHGSVVECMPRFCPDGAVKVWVVMPQHQLKRAKGMRRGEDTVDALVTMAWAIPQALVFFQRPGDVVVIPAGFPHAAHTCYDEGVTDPWCASGGHQFLTKEDDCLQTSLGSRKNRAVVSRLRLDTCHKYESDLIRPLWELWFGGDVGAEYPGVQAAYTLLNDLRIKKNGTEAMSQGASTARKKRERYREITRNATAAAGRARRLQKQ